MAAKLDRGVIAKARYVAELRGVSLAEYLTETVRPAVERDFARATRPAGPGEGQS